MRQCSCFHLIHIITWIRKNKSKNLYFVLT
nr:MAG TPA: hypothetical protein [Caudoviricetes sp.]